MALKNQLVTKSKEIRNHTIELESKMSQLVKENEKNKFRVEKVAAFLGYLEKVVTQAFFGSEAITNKKEVPTHLIQLDESERNCQMLCGL